VLLFIASRRRDRREGVAPAPGRLAPTLVTVAVGLLAWALFAFKLHALLIGVRPFGGPV
jgi:hypothetical protein